MNFDKWCDRADVFAYKQDAEKGWEACKAEIVSLMEERSKKCCGTKAVELDRMIAVIRTVV